MEAHNVMLPTFKQPAPAVSFSHPVHSTTTTTTVQPPPIVLTQTATLPKDYWGTKLPVLLQICHARTEIELPKLLRDFMANIAKQQQKILGSKFSAIAHALKVDPPHVSHTMLTMIINLAFHSYNINFMSSGFSMWYMSHMPPSEMDITNTLTNTWDAVLGQHVAVVLSNMTQIMKSFKLLPPTL
eukprot:10070108-Ditylum_brightwellii.AAC.1